jgi:hypothetical protein
VLLEERVAKTSERGDQEEIEWAQHEDGRDERCNHHFFTGVKVHRCLAGLEKDDGGQANVKGEEDWLPSAKAMGCR